MDKNFLVGGEELSYPGDSRGSAANVINCRCTNAPFPKEETLNERQGGIVDSLVAAGSVAIINDALQENENN